jgi:ribonuclease HI
MKGERMLKVEIYTDGGCSGNPGPGAWAAILLYDNKKIEISGNNKYTTNNRMELTAVINALKKLFSLNNQKYSHVHIYTDSQYVQKGISQWIQSWLKKGWRNSTGQPVKNKHLWQELLALTKNLSISWHWVKGHSDNQYNTACDKSVQQEIAKLKHQ